MLNTSNTSKHMERINITPLTREILVELSWPGESLAETLERLWQQLSPSPSSSSSPHARHQDS